MPEPLLENEMCFSLASCETQKRVADLEAALVAWRAVEAHEHRMGLAVQNDNAYHTSSRYQADALTLQRLRQYAEEA